MRKVEMIENKFGKLTVLSKKGKDKNRKILYECECECGNITIVHGTRLRTGRVLSCGCYRLEKLREKCVTHGKTKSPEYITFLNMRARCYNKSHMYYYNYGGRGIKVCDRWLESFDNFYEDMGERPSPKHQLDRIDNNDNYRPDNCRWILAHQNANNRRVQKDWGVSQSSTGKYYALMERQQVRRNGKSVKNKEDALKLRDSWLKEYEENPELWIEKTLNKTYNKS